MSFPPTGLTVLVSTHYMDEAEHHRINYIAYGRLVAHGTVAQVIRDAGLTTYTVVTDRPGRVARQLAGAPSVDQVAPFGATLHVTGTDPPRLRRHWARRACAAALADQRMSSSA